MNSFEMMALKDEFDKECAAARAANASSQLDLGKAPASLGLIEKLIAVIEQHDREVEDWKRAEQL